MNTAAVLFGMLLVEMATGKRLKSLDDISTQAASGELTLSLPVLQVCSLFRYCATSPYTIFAHKGYKYNCKSDAGRARAYI